MTQSVAESTIWRSSNGIEFLCGDFRDFVFAPHAHDRDLVALVTRGAIEICDPYGSATAATGQIVLFDHDRIHWGHAAQSTGWSILSVYVPPVTFSDLREDFGRSASAASFSRIVATDRELASKFSELVRFNGAEVAPLAWDTVLTELLVEVLAQRTDAPFDVPNATTEMRAVRIAREYLHSRTEDNVTLDELAEISGVGKFWLLKSFKATHGVPPHTYLVDLRIRRALHLLREGREIAEVAAICGFADQSHLTRCFKRAVGATPGVFRMPEKHAIL